MITGNPREFCIRFPNGDHYFDPQDMSQSWPLHRAKAIAANVAVSRNTTVTLFPVATLTSDAPNRTDNIWSYVNTLKGKALSRQLRLQGLVIGGDPVASKRQRLFDHFNRTNAAPK